jgi:hypothetical protein
MHDKNSCLIYTRLQSGILEALNTRYAMQFVFNFRSATRTPRLPVMAGVVTRVVSTNNAKSVVDPHGFPIR